MASSVIRFDFCTPSFGKATADELYRESIEMAAWADARGFGTVVLSEHHCVEEGYLASPLVMTGILAGRTRGAKMKTVALLAPLYNPVRLAEDLALLDVASGGRVTVVAGLGYRRVEYDALGIDFRCRGKLFDECLEVLLQAWKGTPFDYRGTTVTVLPRPISRPRQLIEVAGSSPAAARRAARFGLRFFPPLHDPELNATYEAECKRLGTEVLPVDDPGEPWMLFVSEDPERSWAEIGPYLLHDATTYASWQTGDQRSYQQSDAVSVETLRATKIYRILTPEECIAYGREAGPDASFRHYPLGGGTPPEYGWESLELFANKVLPHLA